MGPPKQTPSRGEFHVYRHEDLITYKQQWKVDVDKIKGLLYEPLTTTSTIIVDLQHLYGIGSLLRYAPAGS